MSGFKKNTRVLLIAFNSFSDITIRTFHKLIENNGYRVKTCILYYWSEKETHDNSEQSYFLKNLIDEFHPDVVGFRVLSPLYNITRQLTQFIKRIYPKTFILWGGLHTIIDPEKCLEVADAVCLGEGDDAILEVLQKIESKDTPENIRNIWIKSDGKITKTPLRPLREDLDSLPTPDYSNVNKHIFMSKASKMRYTISAPASLFLLGPPVPYHPRVYYTITSRGCPYACSYCTNSFYRNSLERNLEKNKDTKIPYVRQRSVGNVIKELINAKRLYNPLKIIFVDDCFALDKQWLKEFSEDYKHFVQIPFYCHIVENFFCEDMARYLKQANCMNIGIGIQSVSEQVRKKIFNRHVTDEKILEINSFLKRYNIEVEYDIIINNPYEGLTEYKKGFNQLLCRLKKPFIIRTFSLRFYKGLEISKRALKDNLIKPSDLCDSLDSLNSHFITYSNNGKLHFQFQKAVHSILGKNYIPNFLIKKIIMNLDSITIKRALIFLVNKLKFLLLLDYAVRRTIVYSKYIIRDVLKSVQKSKLNKERCKKNE